MSSLNAGKTCTLPPLQAVCVCVRVPLPARDKERKTAARYSPRHVVIVPPNHSKTEAGSDICSQPEQQLKILERAEQVRLPVKFEMET